MTTDRDRPETDPPAAAAQPPHGPAERTRSSISMHEDIPVWYDCCSCEAEPYWLEACTEDGEQNKGGDEPSGTDP